MTDPLIRILFFADSHLGLDYPIRRRSERRYRGDDFFRNFEYILQLAKEQEVDLVIHGGDLFDRSEVHPRIVNKAYDMLFEFADQGIPLVLVPGNHDRSTLPSSLFLQHPNLHIFYEPGVFHFTIKNRPLDIAGFPFVRKIGTSFSEILEQLESQVADDSIALLLMHQAVESAQVGLSNYTFRAGPEVIALSQFNSTRFHGYLSGHIHRQQTILTPSLMGGFRVPFIYPGSIERTSFAERAEAKGFLTLAFDRPGIPQIDFGTLPARKMHSFAFSEDVQSYSDLEHIFETEIADLEKDALVRIVSPTEQISGWLRDVIKKEGEQNREYTIRHKWLKRGER